MYLGIEGMIAQVIYDYLFYLSAEIFDYAVQQIVCHGPGRLDTL
jgi:hypothetical protein